MLTIDSCTVRGILCALVEGCLNSQSTCMSSEMVRHTRHSFFLFVLLVNRDRQRREVERVEPTRKTGYHALGVCVLVVSSLQCVICLSLDVSHLHNPALGGREVSSRQVGCSHLKQKPSLVETVLSRSSQPGENVWTSKEPLEDALTRTLHRTRIFHQTPC